MGAFLGDRDFNRVCREAGVFAQMQEDPAEIGIVGQSATLIVSGTGYIKLEQTIALYA